MKDHASEWQPKAQHVSAGIIVALLLYCPACHQREHAKLGVGAPPDRAAETWKFWEAFNKAAVAGTGIEALKSKTYEGDVETADTCLVLEDIIAAEQERGRAITSLPVLHVDPDLAAYAVDFCRSRTELAGALQDYVALAKRGEEITSAPVLGFGLLLNLLSHSEDKEDGILWRALLDEAKQTAANVQQLRAPAGVAEVKAVSARNALAQLPTEEMSVRVKLSQRFDREFPPLDTYATAAAAARTNTALSKTQIIQTLIGHGIGGWPNRWRFDSPKESVTLNILSVTNSSDVLAEYAVQTHVKGIPSGQEHDFELRLSYGWLHTRWALIDLQQVQ